MSRASEILAKISEGSSKTIAITLSGSSSGASDDVRRAFDDASIPVDVTVEGDPSTFTYYVPEIDGARARGIAQDVLNRFKPLPQRS